MVPELDKVKTTCYYGIKISLIISAIITVFIMLFAPQISLMFTYNQTDGAFHQLIIDVLKIVSVFLLVTPVGGICAMTLQGMGRGTLSLLLTIIRELVFVVLLAYVFGIIFNFGVNGIFVGFLSGLAIGSLIALTVFKLVIKREKEMISLSS